VIDLTDTLCLYKGSMLDLGRRDGNYIKPMVLVSDKPDSDISILQTKLSHREGHEARCIGLETMPLDQYVEGGHGECEPGVEIRPDPVHDLLEVAH
jgi:hypothetical protein